MTIFKKIGIAVLLCLIAVSFITVDFYIPRHHVIMVTGVDVVRKDQASSGKTAGGAESPQSTRDTFYIYGDDMNTGDSRAYENEDNGWYLKFNSADVQAQATSLVENKQSALVSYYGWRWPLFSMFPNIISLKKCDPDYRPFPLSQIIGYGLFATFWLIIVGVFMWFKKRRKNKANGSVSS